MSDKSWVESDEGKDHVRAVLMRSGIPLELQVRKIAEAFTRSLEAEGGAYFSKPLIYRDLGGVPRELDWFIAYRQSVAVEYATFELSVRVIIECKQRLDVEWFAFPIPKEPTEPYRDVAPPILSNASYSRAFCEALLGGNHLFLRDDRIAALEFKGKNPTIFKEGLTANVAAASLDFVNRDMVNQVWPHPSGSAKVLQALDIVSRFEAASAGETSRRFAILSLLNQLTEKEHQQYLTAISGKEPQSVDVVIYLPILCVNGPLHAVNMSAEATIDDFSRLNTATTRVHLQKWPGAHADRAILAGPGFTVLVTSIQGLESTLQYTHGILGVTRRVLQGMGARGISNRLPLETAVVDVILQHTKEAIDRQKL